MAGQEISIICIFFNPSKKKIKIICVFYPGIKCLDYLWQQYIHNITFSFSNNWYLESLVTIIWDW